MKQTVELEDEEWKSVLGCLAQAPWTIANPLLMKMGAQLQQQTNKQQTNNSGETAAAQGDPASSRAN